MGSPPRFRAAAGSWPILAVLAAVSILSYAALVAAGLWRDYERTVAEAERHTLGTVRLVAGLLTATVADIDHQAADLLTNAATTGVVGPLPEPLAALAATSGRGEHLSGPAPLATRLDPHRADRVSLVHDERIGWMVVFRRSPPGVDGRVAVAVPVRALRRMLDPVTPPPGGHIGLALADGTPVSGDPGAAPVAGAEPFADALARHPFGTVWTGDRDSVLVAYDSVRTAPLVVTMTIPRAPVVEGWRRSAADAARAGAVVGIVVPVLLVVLFRWMRRVQAAEEARRAAERANRAKSDFLALMSHELRTPLNTVLGFAEMIRDRAWGPHAIDRYAEYAADIHAAGTHLLSLLNDVLDLAKIEAGRMTLTPEPVDPAALADACLRLNAGQARASAVTVTAEITPDAGTLHADPRALRQIVVNLLSNACKFTPRGGSVRLVIDRRPDGGCRVTVADTGIGMTPEGITRSLQRFGQAHDPSIGSGVGTGLGLPLAKGLVELHGGTLSIDSEPGRGTTVTLDFPPAP